MTYLIWVDSIQFFPTDLPGKTSVLLNLLWLLRLSIKIGLSKGYPKIICYNSTMAAQFGNGWTTYN